MNQAREKLSVRSYNAWKWKDTRVCDLGLRFRDSRLASYRQRLFHELGNRSIHKFRPSIYFGDDWFTPDRTIAISVPFYLATPNLVEFFLVAKPNGVEGASQNQFLRLLRHECGHAFDHAYRISMRNDFVDVFGNPGLPYNPDIQVDTFDDACFVKNLNPGYAQTHPYEDFAETFAVWLEADEKKLLAFRSRPIIKAKIDYINKVAKLFGNKPTFCSNRTPLTPTWRIRKTVMQMASTPH